MTKILYNKAAKTFMDAISQGFDEHGAYDKVEKKHGKVLADAVWAEAQAEMKVMKQNPRYNDAVFNKASDYYFKMKEQGYDPDQAANMTASMFGRQVAKEIYELEKPTKKKNPRTLVGQQVKHSKKGRGKIIDERPTYVVVKFTDNTQDRFEKSRIIGK